MNLRVLAEDGSQAGDVTLSGAIFAAKVNVPLMHQVVTAQLAAARAGTHSTKTRAEVSGGGKKPWRQKGTGRARHGSTREPQWVGGGITFGPKPRSYAKATPKKMKALALRSALSDRAREDKVLVVEDLAFDGPRTKRALDALNAWGAEGKALVVLAGHETDIAYSFRNIPRVHVVAEHQLNVYDVLHADTVVFLRAALDAFQARAAVLPGRRAAREAPESEAAEAEATRAEAVEAPEIVAEEIGGTAEDGEPE